MINSQPARESNTLATIRKLLFGTLVVGVAGTVGELILLGHTESPAQWVPLIALAASALAMIWHHSRPTPATVLVMQACMAIFIVAGVIGVGLHVNGNAGFERELHPDERGIEFVRKTVAGATPILAPGSMVLLGLVGFAHTYRHPCMADPASTGGKESHL
jgi:hypothetical protein